MTITPMGTDRSTATWPRAAAAAVLIVVLTGSGVAAQSPDADSDGLLSFVRAAERYAFMHRRLERQLPPLEINANPEAIRKAIDAMAAVVRAERPDARQGDFFNAAAQVTIRTRIAGALRTHGFTPADLLEAERAEIPDGPPVALRVNGEFPWRSATAMFPSVLEALPPLPPELQYRIVRRDLVLIDVHASLVVDILPLAVGDAGSTDSPGATTDGGPSPELPGLVPEPAFISKVIDLGTRRLGDGSGEKSGLYAEMANMVTGAGWISGGLGYRHWVDGDDVVFDVSAGVSWRSYKMARARLEFPTLLGKRAVVGTEARWQDYTQNPYFGAGAATIETDRSEYRLKSLNLIGYSNVKPVSWFTIGARAGWLRRPAISAPGGSFGRDAPAAADLFPDEPVFQLTEQPNYAHGELSLTADTRDHRSHPLRGAVYRAVWNRYWADDQAPFSFQRFEAEAAQFVPLAGSRVTLALRGWLVASDTAEGATVPFYLMPSLGGSNTLRAFSNYRFHDRHMVVANVEARLALMTHVDLAVFADAGNVAARLADLDFDKTSIGAGLRLHSERSTFARIEVAHGREGWRVLVNTSDPLHLSRLTRRVADVPFVP